MLKYRLKDRGDISWLLAQLSLFLATSFLLASIAGFAFYNDWVKEAEIKNIVSNFASAIYSVDLMEFPGYKTFTFPDKNFSYEVRLSSEYITIVRNDGKLKKNIEVHKKLLIKVYPRCDGWEWRSGKELEEFMEEKYSLGYSVEDYLKENLSGSIKFFSSEPFIIYPGEKIFLEKIRYCDEYVIVYKG
ncbi:MAG: hypothetical protein H5T45_05840 [Thermoplasmatales archaeon]|nr:hypothetical protein [Thermoplasmatales archaeon]